MATADRVQDTSTSTGTGNFVLSGSAPAGFRPLSAVGAVGATFGYVIENGAEWEVGIGTITAANTFSRAPSASSNAGQLVNFSAGTKTVYHSITAAQFAQYMSAGVAAFASAIPLSTPGLTILTPKVLTGNLALTIAAGAVTGAQAWAPVIGDGASTLTVSGAKQLGFSMDFDNRAGIENQLQFFYDGRYAWYSISQELNAVAADVTPPTEVSASVANATPTFVDFQFSEAMDTTHVPPASTIAVSGHAVTALTFVSSILARATLSAGLVNGETARVLGYTAAGSDYFRDVAGNALADFSGKPITNNVGVVATAPTAPTIGTAVAGDGYVDVYFTRNSNGGAAVIDSTATLSTGETATGTTSPIRVTAANGAARTATVKDRNSVGLSPASAASNSVTPAAATAAQARLTNRLMVTESGSGPWTYTGSGSGDFSGNAGGLLADSALALLLLGANSSIKMTLSNYSSGNDVLFGFMPASTSAVGNFNLMPYSVFAFTNYAAYEFGAATAINGATVTPATGDVIRLTRSGTTIVVEVSKNAGGSWTTIHTWTGAPTTSYRVEAIPRSAGAITNLLTTGAVVG